jgi:hypothetical protein
MQSPQLSPLSPLASILIDIERSIQARIYYPALLVALTLPDICCGLTLPNSDFTNKKQYVAFVDKYTTVPDLGLDGLACYMLRGGVVHRANMAGHPYIGVTNVIFTIPETGHSIHAMQLVVGNPASPKKAAMLDLITFCKVMVAAVHAWYADNHAHPTVIKNMDNLIRYCPEGLSPFLGGAPVVASGE